MDKRTKWQITHGYVKKVICGYETDFEKVIQIANDNGITVSKVFLDSVKEKYPEYFVKGGIK